MNLEPSVQPDDVIADKYVVERVIGQGAVGVVVAARHRQLDRQVAIKLLRPELARRPELAERFRRLARAAAAVTGEHVCRILDVCTNDAGLPYVVMEYAEGQDLAAELTQCETLPYGVAVDYVLQACEALAEALVAGLVHRDLKPSKLCLTTRQDGSRCIKLLDLGTSELSNDTPANLRAWLLQPSAATSPAWLHACEYLAPEQLDSLEQVTPATNVWALGALLYRLLSGRPPFRASSAAQLAQALRDEPVLTVVPPGCELPEKLLAVVQRALAKDVNDRYRSIAELAQALAPFAPARARLSAERVSRLLPPTAASGPIAPSAALREEPKLRARGWKGRLVIAALIPPAVMLVALCSRDTERAGAGSAPVAATPRLDAGAARVEEAVVASARQAEPESETEVPEVEQPLVLAGEQQKPAALTPAAPRRRVIVSSPQLTAAGRYRLSDFGGRR